MSGAQIQQIGDSDITPRMLDGFRRIAELWGLELPADDATLVYQLEVARIVGTGSPIDQMAPVLFPGGKLQHAALTPGKGVDELTRRLREMTKEEASNILPRHASDVPERPRCVHCGKPATALVGDRLLCTEHSVEFRTLTATPDLPL